MNHVKLHWSGSHGGDTVDPLKPEEHLQTFPCPVLVQVPSQSSIVSGWTSVAVTNWPEQSDIIGTQPDGELQVLSSRHVILVAFPVKPVAQSLERVEPMFVAPERIT